MLLKSKDNSEFELTILGYEFPELEKEEYDSNWLVISIRVKKSEGSWEAKHPCLLTWEVAHLSKWLRSLPNNESVESEEDFIEPNLSFQVTKMTEEYITLRVFFGMKFKPLGTPGDSTKMDKFWMDLTITPDDLESAADSLYSELSRFPERATK